MKTHFFALFLLLATAFFGCKTTETAQTANSDVVPDAIFFKVADDYPLALTFFDDGRVNPQSLPFLQKLNHIEIVAVTKPFTLDDPKLQRTFRLHFQPTSEIDNLIKNLEKMSEVEYAEKIYNKKLLKK